MFMQIKAGNTAMAVFALAVICVFLAARRALRKLVAALGRDPGGPALPALLGGRRARDASRRSTSSCRSAWWCCVGLACKNAILIVEFAKQTAAAGGTVPVRGDAGGLAAAAAADPDDVVGVHPRGRPAGDRGKGPGPRCAGRWGRPSSAACSGRDRVRDLPHPGCSSMRDPRGRRIGVVPGSRRIRRASAPRSPGLACRLVLFFLLRQMDLVQPPWAPSGWGRAGSSRGVPRFQREAAAEPHEGLDLHAEF